MESARTWDSAASAETGTMNIHWKFNTMITKFNLGNTAYRFVLDDKGCCTKAVHIKKIEVSDEGTKYLTSDSLWLKENVLFYSTEEAVRDLIGRCLPQYRLVCEEADSAEL